MKIFINMWLSTYFEIYCFISRFYLSDKHAVALDGSKQEEVAVKRCNIEVLVLRSLIRVLSVLTILLWCLISVTNAQQLVSMIEPSIPPITGEYRSMNNGNWNSATTWQEWTGTAWASASTFPSETSLTTPVLAGWNTSVKTGSENTHTINLPEGIESGDLLFIFWTGAQTRGGNVALPSGFTELYSINSSSRRRMAWFKVANGSEKQTIDVRAGTGVSTHTSYRIAAGTYSGIPAVSIPATGNNSSPDPPVLSSGFGAVPTLWIATSHSDGNNSASSPSGYPPPITAYSGTEGNDGARTTTTHLITTSATSQNPGTFSLDQNSNWAANTIAVQGAYRKAVVQNEHTITVINSVTVADVDVFGTLNVNTNTVMTITSGSTLMVHEGGRLRLPGNNNPGMDARIAGAGNFILSEGGHLEIGSEYGITSSGTTASFGNIRVSGMRTFHAGAHYIYNRTGLARMDQNTGTGYPTNLSGSLTIDNPGTVTRAIGGASNTRTITTGTLYLTQGIFAVGVAGFTMGNNTSVPNATIVRTGGFLTGGLGNNWYQVIYKGDSKVSGPELLGNGLRDLTVDLLDKSQVLTLNTNRTIPGTLTLTAGIMNTNSNTITVSSYATDAISGGSSDSFVQGNLVRGIASGANTYNFPLGSDGFYAPVKLAFTANNINRNVMGSSIGSNHSDIASSGLIGSKLERHWTFSATGGGSYNYSPTFSWDSADEEDGFEFNNAIVARYSGSTWTYPIMSVKTITSATATGLNGFGDFQLGSEDMTPDAGRSSIKADRISDIVANNTDASIVTVTVRNSNGNPVGAGVDVFLRITGGSLGDGSLNPSGSWKTNVDGQVEVNLTSTVANNVEVIGFLGTDDEGEWIGGDKINATVEVNFNAGAATSLVIVTQPVGRASGSAMAAQPVIHILDANDNVVTDDSTREVTVAITSGDGGALGGMLSIIADGGVATFSTLTLAGTVGETYGLTFVSEGLTEAVSDGVRLSAHGSAAQIELSGLVLNLPSGDIRQLTATLKDGAGNLIDTGKESSFEITFSQSTELGSVTGLNTIAAERGVALITVIGENAGQVTVIASTESPALANELTFTITVDKTTLQAAITETEDFIETDWSFASWTGLQVVFTKAQIVLDNTNAAQLEVDAALAQLNAAIVGLTVDKSSLQAAITDANVLTESEWSPASWTALEAAELVLADDDATQSAVNDATAALASAIAALQPAQKMGMPTNLVGEGGDKQVRLTWSAPTDGGTAIDYLVEYSIDNGATWESYNDGISVNTESTVTGLMNNRAYVFRVAAVNESGTGAYSAASPAVISTVPVPDEDDELPQPDIGEAVVIVDGKRENVTLEVVDNSILRLRGDGFEMDLTSIDVNGESVQISDVNAVIRILRGEGSMIRLTGYGYEPGTHISVYIFSQPVLLGQIPVKANGTFDGTLPVPADLDVGLHTLQANGLIRHASVENSVSVGLLVVENTGQRISFGPLPEKVYGDAPFKLDALASSKLPVSYRISGMDGQPTDIAELLDDNTLKINKTGPVRITATQNGNDVFDAAGPVTQILHLKL